MLHSGVPMLDRGVDLHARFEPHFSFVCFQWVMDFLAWKNRSDREFFAGLTGQILPHPAIFACYPSAGATQNGSGTACLIKEKSTLFQDLNGRQTPVLPA